MDDNKQDEFSRTQMWKKSLAADAERQSRWTGKVSMILGTTGAIAVVVMLLYFMLR